MERANLSYQPPSKKRAHQQKATVAEDKEMTFSTEASPKKKTEKRYSPKEKPQKPDGPIRKFFSDPEANRAYLQQQEALEKQYSKFEQEWKKYVDEIREYPDALPDFSEMPEWLQELGENSVEWIMLKGL